MTDELINNLKNDFAYLLKNVEEIEINKIFLDSLYEAFLATTEHWIRNIKYFIKILFIVSIKTYLYIKKLMKLKSLTEIIKTISNDCKSSLRKKFNKLQSIWESMSYEEKRQTILDFTIVTMAALIFGGGFDFEGGLPDSDLKTSIGNHRNVFSHTILIGFTAELTLRFVYKLLVNLENKGIYPKSRFLKSFLEFFKNKNKKIIKGMWLGLFFHFMKDANVFSSRTKPYSGIHGLTMNEHKQLYATNALLAGIFSFEDKE